MKNLSLKSNVLKSISTISALIILVVIVLSFSPAADKQFKISGTVKSKGKAMQGVVVSVFWQDSKLISVATKNTGYFEVFVDYQKSYKLEFSKQGFVSQHFNVSTKVPPTELKSGNLYPFSECNVEMIPQYKDLDAKLLETPINEIKWQDEQGMIEFDPVYEAKIKPKFETVKTQVNEIEKKIYDQKIKEAQEEEAKKNFDNALINYYEASNILPKEKLAKTKISEVKKEISQTSTNEESYLKNIKKGNELYISNDYDDAIKYYNNALIYKPEDSDALLKISDCENAKSKKFIVTKDNYYNFIKKADSLYTQNDFESSIVAYQNASRLIPDEQYPKTKIAELKLKTNSENTYEKNIEKADLAYKNNDTELAIKHYKKALELKADATYPKQKIAEIEEKIKNDEVAKNKAIADNEAFAKSVKSGDDYSKINRFEDAITAYKKAIEIRPSEVSTHSKLKVAESQFDEQNKGKQYFAAVEKSNTLLKEKRYTEAKKALESTYLIDKTKAKDWTVLCGKAYIATDVPTKMTELNKLIEQDKVAIQKNIDAKPIDQTAANTPAPKPISTTAVQTTTTPATKPVAQTTTVPAKTTTPTQTIAPKTQPAVVSKPVAVKAPTTQTPAKTEDLNKKIDDYLVLVKQYEKSGDKKEVAKMMNTIGDVYLEQKSLDKAIEFYDKTLKIREQQGDKKGVADVSENIAVAFYDSGKYETAINYYEKSLLIREKLNDKKGVVSVMNDLASVNENTFRYEKAIDYYQKSLKVSETLGDKETNVKILNKMANVYYENKELDKSIEFYEKSAKTGKEIGNDKKVAESLNNIGVLYSNMGNLDKAEKYLKQSMTYYDKTNDKMAKSLSLNNLGNVNFESKQLDKALDYYEQSLKIKEELKYFIGVATSLHNIGAVQFEMNDINKAVEYFKKSNKIAIEMNDKKLMSRNYKYLTDVCIKKNDYKGAYECYQNYAKANFVIEGDESRLVNEMITDDNQLSDATQIQNLKIEVQKQKVLAQFEASRNVLQLNLKNLEIEKGKQEIAKQRQLLYSALIGFIIILSFSIMLFRLYVQKKKANVLLAVKNEEILQQKEEIEAQRDEIEVQRDYVVKQRDKISFQKQEITDSIVYAGLIQTAILPPTSYMNELLNNFFVYYKPRDIVSGDFYWTTNKGDKTIVVVADCTGHGVPGAFMSMLGISSLNEIVNKTKELDAAHILNQLRDHIVDALHQKGDNKSRDGMDISISVFDEDFTNLQFAGAYNPVYIIRNADNNTLEENLILQEICTANNDKYNLFEIKADKMPVSIYDNMSPFVNKEFKLVKGDAIYMFSDGYSDQFGGPEEKKFKAKQFKHLLLESQEKSMDNQMEAINKAHLDWKGNTHQIDDILVVGIKI